MIAFHVSWTWIFQYVIWNYTLLCYLLCVYQGCELQTLVNLGEVWEAYTLADYHLVWKSIPGYSYSYQITPVITIHAKTSCSALYQPCFLPDLFCLILLLVWTESSINKSWKNMQGCNVSWALNGSDEERDGAQLPREVALHKMRKQRNLYKKRVGAFSAISVLFEFRWVMWSCCLSALLSLRHSLPPFPLFFTLNWQISPTVRGKSVCLKYNLK